MAMQKIEAWEQIRSLLYSQAFPGALEALLDSVQPTELVHAIFQLTEDEQRKLLSIVSPERAADLIEDLPGSVAADLIEEMPAAWAWKGNAVLGLVVGAALAVNTFDVLPRKYNEQPHRFGWSDATSGAGSADGPVSGCDAPIQRSIT